MTGRLVVYVLTQDFRDDSEELKQAFEYIDGAKKGKITENNLEKMAE